ncbi:phosphotransferase [Kribbella sindirgiensis]|uniref:Aminoglycoside phosphotransferase family protein n=1 Tax=Kribbella sindirgiensis TaxID=1124744 RepID=A0A4R0J1Q0_9ACTN|nr:phosphotransferase [Kribbella sindirgiensis]TCC35065.1 aminoglycoside phosphotransferase family protein [Kribbella sindirgiensis]
MTETAVQAAATAARNLGLTVTDPSVLYEAFSTVVHLLPSPVVARVPMNLPGALQEPEPAVRRQQRELDVVVWMAEQGLPVVPPSPLVPLAPAEQDGLSMTFWTYVEVDQAAEPDYVGATARVPELHAQLVKYPGELPWMTPLRLIGPGLAAAEAVPGLLEQEDVDRARAEWKVLEPILTSRAGFEAVFPSATVQPLHGDAPSWNLITTVDGPLWADFEDVTIGPLEWDLAGFGPDLCQAYDEGARSRGLPTLDPQIQQVMDLARALQVLVCTPLVPQFPALADGIRMFAAQWRDMPFAGGC